MYFFDPMYFLFIGPAILLGLWAQFRVKSAFHAAQEVPTSITGAQVARHVLDDAGLYQVAIEPVGGFMSDHYDPRAKVLRLSPEVYGGRDMAAAGVAAHEAGHAIQDAVNYAPLSIRNAAVPVANFGASFSWILIIAGMMFSHSLVLFGILAFAGVVFFQLINLPVEFDASSRAKERLAALRIVPAGQQGAVNSVLNAAAWTYVAATLQSVLTLAYLLMRFAGASRDE